MNSLFARSINIGDLVRARSKYSVYVPRTDNANAPAAGRADPQIPQDLPVFVVRSKMTHQNVPYISVFLKTLITSSST